MKLRNYLLPASIFFLLSVVSVTCSAGQRSGYEYIKPETQAMQNDDFANPGLIAVERGEELFNTIDQESNKSCASCHGEDGRKLDTKEIARYPVYDEKTKSIVNLQTRINNCRRTITEIDLPLDHADLIALESYVRHLAAGEKVNVKMDGAIRDKLISGERLYKTRYGLIDMSCYHCHALYPGQMIRGQKISQGQANGFPAYRLDTGEVTSLSQRIQQCMVLLRAEPFTVDSAEMQTLELYIMSRSNGLMIETPAVRY